mmetsp:Transcript_104853/g.302539  ORF Transcript_104853/g.302539 Transcript_104853/m.302539 type:complete len:140 (-) Transcript_104853:254-673(-)
MHRRIGNAYEEGETGASGEERQDRSAGSGGNKSGVIAEGRAAAQAMGGALVSVTSAAPQEGMLAVLFGSRIRKLQFVVAVEKYRGVSSYASLRSSKQQWECATRVYENFLRDGASTTPPTDLFDALWNTVVRSSQGPHN